MLNGLFVTHFFTTSTGGLSSSSDEYSSPIPNQQINPNHQFSPTNPYNRQRQANGMPQNPQYNPYPQYTNSISPIRGVAADPLGMDIFILDSYVVILFSDKWTSWGRIPGTQITPRDWIFWTTFYRNYRFWPLTTISE